MTRREREDTAAVVQAAVWWWRTKRPMGWTQRQHLANPDVNTTTTAQSHLAYTVALLVQTRGRRTHAR